MKNTFLLIFSDLIFYFYLKKKKMFSYEILDTSELLKILKIKQCKKENSLCGRNAQRSLPH